MSLRQDENSLEFKEASRVATLLNRCANRYFNRLSNTQARLQALMYNAVIADNANARGTRVFKPENAILCKNFNVSKNVSIQSLLPVPFTAKLEVGVAPQTKKAKLECLLPFVPAINSKKPAGATHLEITVSIVAIDFANSEAVPVIIEKSEQIPLNSTVALSTIETPEILIPTTHTAFSIVEVHFAQEVNSVLYPFESKSLNAAFISDAI